MLSVVIQELSMETLDSTQEENSRMILVTITTEQDTIPLILVDSSLEILSDRMIK